MTALRRLAGRDNDRVRHLAPGWAAASTWAARCPAVKETEAGLEAAAQAILSELAGKHVALGEKLGAGNDETAGFVDAKGRPHYIGRKYLKTLSGPERSIVRLDGDKEFLKAVRKKSDLGYRIPDYQRRLVGVVDAKGLLTAVIMQRTGL